MRTVAIAAGLLCVSSVAWAQMPPPADQVPPTDPAPPPPPPVETTTTTTTTSTPAPEPTPVAAPAPPSDTIGSAIGIGVHAMLGNLTVGTTSIGAPAGPSIVYNGGRFHIEGILTYVDIDGGGNTLGIAGRGWYHVHESAGAALSVGGGLGIVNFDDGTADSSLTIFEGGAQIRFFVTRNVAMSASLGLSILRGEGDSGALVVSGQLMGGLGLTYFIF